MDIYLLMGFKMNTYNFTIARFVPNTIRNEPVNIGVVITDNKSNESFGKFVELDTVKHEVGSFNTKMIDHIISKLDGKKTVKIELEELSGISNKLQFTSRRATKDQNIHDAANNIFNQYISIAKQRETQTPRSNIKMLDTIKEKLNSTFNPELIRTKYTIGRKMWKFSVDFGIVTSDRENLIHGFNYKEKKTILKESWYRARALEEAQHENKNISASMIVETPKKDDEMLKCFNFAKEKLKEASWEIVELENINKHIEKIKKLYMSV